MKKNYIGFEIFRFVGSYFIIMGHLFLSSFVLFSSSSHFESVFSGNIARLLMIVPVPVFIMIGGYFVLGKKTNNDFYMVKKGFKLLLKYFIWINIFMLINYLMLSYFDVNSFTSNPYEWFVGISFMGMSNFNYTMLNVFKNYDWCVLLTGHFWYLIIYSGFLIISPLFKKFFQSKNIKLIRFMIIFLFIASFLGTNMSVFANYIDNAYLDIVLKNYNVMDLDKIVYPLFFYFLLGGYFCKDKSLRNKINSIPSIIYLIIFILSIGLLPFIYDSTYLFYNSLYGFDGISGIYNSIILLPSIISLFLFFLSLNNKSKNKGKVKSAILNNSYKTSAIYLLHPVVICIFINVIGMTNYSEFLLSLNNLTSIYIVFTFALYIYIFTYFLVSILFKIPYVKKKI